MAPKTFAARIDAEGWLAAERKKIDTDSWGAAERTRDITLSDYAQRWLELRPLRPRTRLLYQSMLDRLILPELGAVKLAALTPSRVREWYAGLGTTHPTQNSHAYQLLHTVCHTAMQDELIDAQPCRIQGATKAGRRRDVDVLSPAELDSLAAAMPEHLALSVTLAAWCGLRWGETTELRRGDVGGDFAVLHIRRAVTYRAGQFWVGEPKTRAGVRDVTIPPHIRPMLKAHLSNHVGRGADSLLFPGGDGNHLRVDRYRVHWQKGRVAIGKPNLRVHDLRHVGAVLAAQAGATTAELMNRLGHTTPAMALRYQHVAAGRDEQIAERMSKLVKPE